MKKLGRTAFDRAAESIEVYARPLEKKIFMYRFCNGSKAEIVKEVRKFQNEDGGFGNGLESDFRMPYSSPKATTIGVQILSGFDDQEQAQEMIKAAVEYFETAFDAGKNRWYIASKQINDFPHAPWWHYNEMKGMTVLDKDWGNPTAAVLSCLYKYKTYVRQLDIDKLIAIAAAQLEDKHSFINAHKEFVGSFALDKLPDGVKNYFFNEKSFDARGEIFSYIKLFMAVQGTVKDRLGAGIKKAVEQLIEYDNEKWTDYVPTPVDFAVGPQNNPFGVNSKKLEENLDFLVDQLEEDGRIYPSWAKDNGYYNGDLRPAYNEWIGVVTLGALTALKNFGRI